MELGIPFAKTVIHQSWLSILIKWSSDFWMTWNSKTSYEICSKSWEDCKLKCKVNVTLMYLRVRPYCNQKITSMRYFEKCFQISMCSKNLCENLIDWNIAISKPCLCFANGCVQFLMLSDWLKWGMFSNLQ
jgi:hypothetical protein